MGQDRTEPAVKTNIITGYLGVGKTTAIQHLLRLKPEHERWAVLVNEFGEVGIDGSLLGGNDQQGIFIREVPGGCMCCSAGMSMQIALNMLLAKARPHRLLIEPTGLGHPKEVVAVLNAEHYRDFITLNKTLCLVDARKISQSSYVDDLVFQQQLEVADLLIANKSELYSERDLEKLRGYLASRSLTKQIKTVSYGQLEPGWLQGLSQTRETVASVEYQANMEKLTEPAPAVYNEQGFQAIHNSNNSFSSYGWVFEANKVFNRQSLELVLSGLEVERLKAVFITEEGVFGYNKSDQVLTEFALDDCLDSRIEIITSKSVEFESLQRELLACFA